MARVKTKKTKARGNPRGTAPGIRLLKPKDVQGIRSRLIAGKTTQAAEAARYGMTAPAISFLARGLTYADVPGPRVPTQERGKR